MPALTIPDLDASLHRSLQAWAQAQGKPLPILHAKFSPLPNARTGARAI